MEPQPKPTKREQELAATRRQHEEEAMRGTYPPSGDASPPAPTPVPEPYPPDEIDLPEPDPAPDDDDD